MTFIKSGQHETGAIKAPVSTMLPQQLQQETRRLSQSRTEALDALARFVQQRVAVA